MLRRIDSTNSYCSGNLCNNDVALAVKTSASLKAVQAVLWINWLSLSNVIPAHLCEVAIFVSSLLGVVLGGTKDDLYSVCLGFLDHALGNRVYSLQFRDFISSSSSSEDESVSDW